jgi:uncharacterized protein (DUF2267 family)
MTPIQNLASAVRVTEEWIDDLRRRLEWHDQERAHRALLAALHGLRDCLPRDEAIYLASELPPLLRGLYYEGWHPGAKPTADSRSSFLKRIHDGVHRDPAVDPEAVARAVLALLAARLPASELEDAKAATPKSLHNLWPS